jgi:hypothetical protein
MEVSWASARTHTATMARPADQARNQLHAFRSRRAHVRSVVPRTWLDLGPFVGLDDEGHGGWVVSSRISNPQQMTNSGTSCTESQEQFAPDRALMPLMGRRVRRPDVPMSDRVTSKLRARVTVGGHRASRATGLSTVDSVSMNLSLNCCPRQARRTH